MTLSFLYWFLLLVSILFGGWYGVSTPVGPGRYGYVGYSLVTLGIFIVIGLKLFGGPIKG